MLVELPRRGLLRRFRGFLGRFVLAQLDAIDEEVKKVVDDAISFADQSPEPPLDDLWRHGFVEEGEPDERPRARVRGATDVKWPSYPTDFKVTWELEPRDPPAATPIKKGAA